MPSITPSNSNNTTNTTTNTANTNTAEEDDDEYQPYIPLSKRRADLLSSHRVGGSGGGGGGIGGGGGGSARTERPKTEEELQAEAEEKERELEMEEERRRERARKERTLLEEAQEVKKQKKEEGGFSLDKKSQNQKKIVSGRKAKLIIGEFGFLFSFSIWEKQSTDAKKSEADIAAAREAEILAALERQQRKLASDAELAKGVTYTESMKTR
jgi:ATP-dependent RNA helicase DDX41